MITSIVFKLSWHFNLFALLENCLNPNVLEAGCDEAGRGCLAGPVFAAAVVLPKDFYHPLLNDSKKINEATRLLLKGVIEKEALHFAVAKVTPKEIDKINILNASFRAMHLALDQLKIHPEQLLIDGSRFKRYKNVQHHCIIKGDGKYANIAAASILAKTYRDKYMLKLHKKFPQYDWDKNKGYPTSSHREAIRKYGLTKHHRISFTCLPPEQPELF